MRRHLIRVALLLCVAIAVGACEDSVGPPSTPSVTANSSPSSVNPSPDEAAPSVIDDFSDPSTGWDRVEGVDYRDGQLIVEGTPQVAGLLVPSPQVLSGDVILSTRARVAGSGTAHIGLFCRTAADLSSLYVGFFDPNAQKATIGRITPKGPKVMGEGTNLDEVTSTKSPHLLRLHCTQKKNGTVQISLFLNDRLAAVGVDPTPLEGSGAGLYFEYAGQAVKGIFDSFEMISSDA